MKKKIQLHPKFATTVFPDEYEIDKQMEAMVRMANKHKTGELVMDVGKVWGLYCAWKDLSPLLKQGEIEHDRP